MKLSFVDRSYPKKWNSIKINNKMIELYAKSTCTQVQKLDLTDEFFQIVELLDLHSKVIPELYELFFSGIKTTLKSQ